MNHLFRKIAVSQRFSETESEILHKELGALKSALEAKQNVNPLEVRPSLCALQLYAYSGV
jgi:hypothetical protein